MKRSTCGLVTLIVAVSVANALLQKLCRPRTAVRAAGLFARTEKNPAAAASTPAGVTRNFITNIIDEDLAAGRNGGRVLTRFPPEPNGYLHLGHAKSILFNFGVAEAYKGATNMRFDDTNPTKEETEYVDAIKDDVRWLVAGDVDANPAPWNEDVRHASDYFDTLYAGAEYLIQQNKAYVDELSADEMREYRGTPTQPGRDSPYRNRPVSESLTLFRLMRDGKLPDGTCVLRAKINMASPNMNMRDPTLYRIRHAVHPMTGDKWPIYPMYDYAHAVSDAIEGITHSLCTLEFADHRPLYDWAIDSLLDSGLLPHCSAVARPIQTEFSRLNLQYTVLSKRKLILLVQDGHVDGWDDPRMPTICGVRRRGVPSAALKLFCERVAISKADQNIDMSVFEDCAREVLDKTAPRAFAVLHPLKVIITNYPKGKGEVLECDNHPKDPSMGVRQIPFGRELFIEAADFFDTGPDSSTAPPQGFKRLVLGGQVRLRLAYVITCDEVVRGAMGEVVELRCSYDEHTRAGLTPEGSTRCKGIVQWVSAQHAVPAEVRLYDRLFVTPGPGKERDDGDFLKDINPVSLSTATGAVIEPSFLQTCSPGHVYQFERAGYFCVDAVDNSAESLAAGQNIKLNRVVTLRDTWVPAKGETPRRGGVGGGGGGGGGGRSTPSAAEDYQRVEFRVGRVLSAELHPGADSLLVEQIDCGDETGPRTVVSGLAKFLSPDQLVDRMVVVVSNLKPIKMRGVVSEGMVLCSFMGEGEAEVVEIIAAPEAAVVGEMLVMEGMATPAPDAVLKSKTAQECFERVMARMSVSAEGEVIWTDDKGKAKRLLSTGGAMRSPSLVSCPVG
jgi:glutaminyl-tRNA synthetase